MPSNQYMDDFDDDGLDSDYGAEDYDGGEALSPEDEASMAEASAEVRKVLGKDSSKVTLRQIQDALWNYYYDVDKTVTYLNKTFIAPPPAKSAPKASVPKKTLEGMSGYISFSAASSPFPGPFGAGPQCSAGEADDLSCTSSSGFPILGRPSLPIQFYFEGMPWLNTPSECQAKFIPPPRPRGGLLGGSEGTGGMSKLQRLAAARKKKNEEKNENGKTSIVEKGASQISISDAEPKGYGKPIHPLEKQKRTSHHATSLLQQRTVPPQNSSSDHTHTREAAPASPCSQGEKGDQDDDDVPAAAVRPPSAFARVLCGPAPGPRPPNGDVILPMPYTLHPWFSLGNFSGPSPDDVVLAAQSKGSKFAKAT